MYYVCKREDEGGQRGKEREENVSAFRTTKCFKISKTSFLLPLLFLLCFCAIQVFHIKLNKRAQFGAKVIILTYLAIQVRCPFNTLFLSLAGRKGNSITGIDHTEHGYLSGENLATGSPSPTFTSVFAWKTPPFFSPHTQIQVIPNPS